MLEMCVRMGRIYFNLWIILDFDVCCVMFFLPIYWLFWIRLCVMFGLGDNVGKGKNFSFNLQIVLDFHCVLLCWMIFFIYLSSSSSLISLFLSFFGFEFKRNRKKGIFANSCLAKEKMLGTRKQLFLVIYGLFWNLVVSCLS